MSRTPPVKSPLFSTRYSHPKWAQTRSNAGLAALVPGQLLLSPAESLRRTGFHQLSVLGAPSFSLSSCVTTPVSRASDLRTQFCGLPNAGG